MESNYVYKHLNVAEARQEDVWKERGKAKKGKKKKNSIKTKHIPGCALVSLFENCS